MLKERYKVNYLLSFKQCQSNLTKQKERTNKSQRFHQNTSTSYKPSIQLLNLERKQKNIEFHSQETSYTVATTSFSQLTTQSNKKYKH